jgi:hypothetical protein
MGVVSYWFALAVGIVMAMLPLEFGDQLSPIAVHLIFWSGLALMAVCAVIGALKGASMIGKTKIYGNTMRGGGTFLKLGGDASGLDVQGNDSESDIFADIGGKIENSVFKNNRHRPAEKD